MKSTIATAGANVDLDNLDSDEVRRCLSYLVSQTVHITSLHLITPPKDQAKADFSDGEVTNTTGTLKLNSRKLPTNHITRVVAPPEVMHVTDVRMPNYVHTDRCHPMFDLGSALKTRQKAPTFFFPKLDPDVYEKRCYTHFGLTYISIGGLPVVRTVSIKNESDKFVQELVKYNIFPKQKHSKGTSDLQTGPTNHVQVACTKYVGNAPFILKKRNNLVASVSSTTPTSLFQCPRLLSYQGPPMLQDGNVRIVRRCHICYLDKPFDTNMCCDKHTDGCGKSLVMGTPVVCDATECELIEGKIYYIAARTVRIVDEDGERESRKGCKVGVVKCLFNQLHLFAHRVGLVVRIMKQDTEKSKTQYMRNHCCSVAEITFIDGGSLF